MGKQHPQAYLHRVARTVMGQCGIVSGDNPMYNIDDERFPQELWCIYGDGVQKVLSRMGPEKRGKISACSRGFSYAGTTYHHEVNQGCGLNSVRSGDEILTLLASYVVVAAIVDIISANVFRWREKHGDAAKWWKKRHATEAVCGA
jgi:hypothetical protein